MTDPTHEPIDPREMRKRITEAARGYDRLDGKPARTFTPAAALMRNTLDASRYLGWSGEDTMTALAYHALLQVEKLTDMVLEQAYLTPSQPLQRSPE